MVSDRFGSKSAATVDMTSAIRPDDEWANLLTHAVGGLFSIMGSGYLLAVVSHRPLLLRVSIGIYVFTLILVYACSTLSHAFYELPRRKWFRMLDQASIFLHIAGVYTPFAVIYFHDRLWLGLLIAMWSIAIWGVVRVFRVHNLSRFDKLWFGVLGCLPGICLPELYRLAPWPVLAWVLAGGMCYGMGVPFFIRSAVTRYSHAVWHLCVIGGSACHYRAVVLAVWDHAAA